MNKKLFSFVNTACGCQVRCYGLGFIGFLANKKDINNKFNRGSKLLYVAKSENDKIAIVLCDFVNELVLFEYIKRFRFTTPVELSFYSAMRNGRRHFLMGAKLC